MATQLRLVDPPPTPEPGRGGRRTTGARPARARVTGSARRRRGAPRRAASWGEWELDASTRRIGREGVAAAREALERAADTERLSRAS